MGRLTEQGVARIPNQSGEPVADVGNFPIEIDNEHRPEGRYGRLIHKINHRRASYLRLMLGRTKGLFFHYL